MPWPADRDDRGRPHEPKLRGEPIGAAFPRPGCIEFVQTSTQAGARVHFGGLRIKPKNGARSRPGISPLLRCASAIVPEICPILSVDVRAQRGRPECVGGRKVRAAWLRFGKRRALHPELCPARFAPARLAAGALPWSAPPNFTPRITTGEDNVASTTQLSPEAPLRHLRESHAPNPGCARCTTRAGAAGRPAPRAGGTLCSTGSPTSSPNTGIRQSRS